MTKRPFRVQGVSRARGFNDTCTLGTYATHGAAEAAAIAAISRFHPGTADPKWRSFVWTEVWLGGGEHARVYTRSEDNARYLIHEQPGAKQNAKGIWVHQDRRPVGEGTLFPVEVKSHAPRKRR